MTGMTGSSNDAWVAQARETVPPRRLEKQMAMASAACGVFGREGYARASVDTLAAAAAVSTRTLYNHFPGGKAQLFEAVIRWTAGQVKDAQLGLLAAMLDPARPPHPEDLERDLTAVARAFVELMAAYPDHFALVRHIHAEAGHVPAEVLATWQEAGPAPVARALAEALGGLASAGLLDLHGDPELAATHFMALGSQPIVHLSHYGVLPLPPERIDRLVTGGVAAFLRAYRAGS